MEDIAANCNCSGRKIHENRSNGNKVATSPLLIQLCHSPSTDILGRKHLAVQNSYVYIEQFICGVINHRYE